MDWFHSLSSQNGTIVHASPVVTSTQNGAPARHVSVLPSNSSSAHLKGSAWENDVDVSTEEAGKPSSVKVRGSKQLRGKRLKEMKAALLQNEDRGVKEGTRDAENDLFTSDTVPSHSTPMVGKKPSKRKNLAVEMDQEDAENLRGQFTDFTFKPRQKLTHADLSVGNTDSSIFLRDNIHEQTEPARPQIQEKGSDERSLSCSHWPAEGGSSTEKFVLGDKNKAEISSEDSRAKKGSFVETEHQQRLLSRPNRLSPCDNDDNPDKQSQSPTKTKVASSTLAKLSRFSFIASSEKKSGDKTMEAEAKTVINTTANNTTTSAREENVNKHTTRTTGSQKNTALHTKKNITAEATKIRTLAPQTGNTRTETSRVHEAVGNPMKRRCFELGPAGLFTGHSLFSSSVIDDDDDDLDVEWN